MSSNKKKRKLKKCNIHKVYGFKLGLICFMCDNWTNFLLRQILVLEKNQLDQLEIYWQDRNTEVSFFSPPN